MPIAQAATFTVTNLNDSGDGSLRQAIADADNSAGDDVIQFQSGLSGTILLTNFIYVGSSNGSLTINGPGAGVLAISSNAMHIFSISSGPGTTLNNLTFRDHRGSGSAIYNGGTLTIDHCVLSNNSFSSGGYPSGSGGAIDNNSIMTITNSILSGNSAVSGGAIFNRGTLTVNNSTLSGNSATVPYSGYGGGYGGAIFSQTGSLLTITNSTLSGNSATNRFADSGGNGYGAMGGAIEFSGGKKLTIINSTLSGNSANSLPTCETTTYECPGRGGALDAHWQGNASDQMTVRDSTFTGNTATNQGGGIYLGYGTLTVGNNIVSGNQAPSARGKEAAAVSPSYGKAFLVSQGHNLFGENGSSGLVDASPIASDKILAGTIGTAIGPLADNGGPTRTHLPVTSSVAINGGDNALIPAGVTTDQRGLTRIINGTVDIGAVEVGPVYRLSVAKQGGNGTITSTPAGIACGATCAKDFPAGMKVTLTAKPDAGYSFTSWLGGCTGTALTCTLTMTTAKNVTALFSNATTHLLTVTKAGYGLGTVTGPGIACGADCTQPYLVGTKVTLTATATAGSAFGGWSNCDTVNVALRQCTVTMANARTVKATFNRPLLTVSKTGTGANLVGTFGLSSGIFCGTDCTEAYNLGTVVYLVALPRPGSTFVGWNNCAANANFPQLCTTTMTVSKTVTAKFSP